MLNLASLLVNSNRTHPSETALIHDDHRLRYDELSSRVNAVAAHLRALGVGTGDRVGLLMPNRMSFTVAYFGILHSGAAVVPISFLSVAREITYALRDSEATALIAWNEFAEHATAGFDGVETCRHLLLADESDGPLTVVNGNPIDPQGSVEMAATNPDDTAVILYTSGTTGDPKGAELTHFNMYSNAQYAGERLLSSPGELRVLGPGEVRARCPAAISFVRADLQPERPLAQRRCAQLRRAVRSGDRSRDHGARQGDGLRWCADDVLPAAPLSRGGQLRS